MKPVAWLGDSRERVKEFPSEAKRKTGYQLERVQYGHEPKDWKPMPTVGIGVAEIRIQEDGAFRLIYMARFSEAVYVLHAFQKKSRRTPRSDIDLARRRFRDLVQARRQG